MKPIKATLNQWSQNIGIDAKTLTRRLVKANVKFKPHDTIGAKDVFTAITGDIHSARARECTARAELLELKKTEQEGRTIDVEDMHKVLRDILLPVRQRLLALPSEAAHLCNPADTQFARAALLEWVDRSLPIIREEARKNDSQPTTEK